MRTFLYGITKYSLALILILLLASIWFAPHLLGWDTDYNFTNILTQLLLSVIVLLMAAFIIYLKYIHKPNRTTENRPESAQQQVADKESWQLFHQETKALYAALGAFFQHWGQKKRHFLRKLPWYVLLGHTGSGKTNLLQQANFNTFPTEHLPDDALKNACPHTWRFTNEAVFLELPFSMLDDNDDEDTKKKSALESINKNSLFFAALLKFIRRNRRKNCLNGVVVTLELPDLLFRSEAKGLAPQQHLKSILSRMHAVLETQMPVYLILTKCDLIAGFREFFANLSKEEREQNWGIAFPQITFSSKRQALDYFNKEFDALIARLQQHLLIRLESERNAEHRAIISYFPQQLEQCKPMLSDLLLQDETAQLRGIYFCSNLQEGNPSDLLMSKLNAHFNLEEVLPFNSISQKRTYFAQKFFPQIIFPEANWALSNSYHWQRHDRVMNRSSIAGMGLLLLLALAGFAYSWQQNKWALDTLADYLPMYQQAVDSYSPDDKSLAAGLPLLNSLKNIQEIYADKSSWSVWLEVFDPLHMRKIINQVWQQTTTTVLMPRVASHLAALLQQNQLPTENLYQALKGYLVFSPAVRADPQWLRPPIRTDLMTTLKDKPEDQAELNAYLAEAVQYPVSPINLDDALITNVRKQLHQVPPVQFAYYEIKQEAENSHDRLDLSNKLEPYFSDVFIYQDTNLATLPALYTYRGYKSLEGERSAALIRHSAEIYRILGIDPSVNSNTLSLQMTPELWALYNADYIQHWQRALSDIQIVPFYSLSQAIQVLDTLSDSTNNLMLKLLHEVKANTATVKNNTMQVSQQFAEINAATGISKTGLQYTRSLKTLLALREYLVMLSNSTNVAQKEFQDASAIMLNNLPNNPIVVLRHQAQQLPAPLNAWFTQIADNSMDVLLKGAHQVANTAWKNEVLPFYQTNIQGRFPFVVASENFVDMTNFGAFFGSDGIYAKYFKAYLAPFINSHDSLWRQYTFGIHSLGLSDATIALLSRASLIRSMYFQGANNTPAVQFSIQPRYLDPQASSINIQLANQSITYRHGPPQSLHWHWPFVGDTQQVSFSFSDFHNQNFSRSFDGPWGWFQMLNATRLEKADTPGHYIWTVTQGDYRASFDLWAPNNLPIFDLNTLKGFGLPEEI